MTSSAVTVSADETLRPAAPSAAHVGTQTKNNADVCLRCAANLNREACDASVQTEVALSGDKIDPDIEIDDPSVPCHRSSTPVPIASSLFSQHLCVSTLSTPAHMHDLDVMDIDSSLALDDSANESFTAPPTPTCSWSSCTDDSIIDDDEVWDRAEGPCQQRKYIIFESQLSSLFRRCQECGAPIIHRKRREIGSMVQVTAECGEGHTTVWQSQPTLRKKMPAGK